MLYHFLIGFLMLGLGMTSGPEELVIDEEVQTLTPEQGIRSWDFPVADQQMKLKYQRQGYETGI